MAGGTGAQTLKAGKIAANLIFAMEALDLHLLNLNKVCDKTADYKQFIKRATARDFKIDDTELENNQAEAIEIEEEKKRKRTEKKSKTKKKRKKGDDDEGGEAEDEDEQEQEEDEEVEEEEEEEDDEEE